MRVQLKGINRTSKRLADGSRVTYYYAWKGGPRLAGQPGSPEFHASYNAAVGGRKVAPAGLLGTVLDAYESSSAFTDLAPRSQRDYRKHLRAIDVEFGDLHIKALEDRRTRGDFLTWRDDLAETSRRNADYRFAVLARVLSWALDRGITGANPCERPGRLYRAKRSETIWSDADEAAFLRHAPLHLQLVLILALWTGQRQGDLLRLPWDGYDGSHIWLKQEKTGVRVVIPVGGPLKAALDAAERKGATILTTERGRAWTGSGFRASWRKACAKAGVVGVTFHDLRGTAVTRLAQAQCTVPEIATLTGHSLKDVEAILEHYLARSSVLAESAIHKLEGRKVPN